MILAPAYCRQVGFAPRGSSDRSEPESSLDSTSLATADGAMETVVSSDLVLATLRVRSGPTLGASVAVRQPQATIGSDPAADVVLPDGSVARRHAQLRLRGGVWTYVDFGSPAGSQVDGEAVRGEALLAPGSSIRIGELDLAFAPQDRWQDSPPERRAEDRAPLLLMPHERSLWPTIAFGLVVCAGFIAVYFLLRNA